MIFTGLCLGGKLDGQTLTHCEDKYPIAIMPDLLLLGSPIDDASVEIKIEIYHFQFLRYTNKENFGFWLHQEYASRDAFEVLVERYAAHCRILSDFPEK